MIKNCQFSVTLLRFDSFNICCFFFEKKENYEFESVGLFGSFYYACICEMLLCLRPSFIRCNAKSIVVKIIAVVDF